MTLGKKFFLLVPTCLLLSSCIDCGTLLCDPETQADCEDAERGHILGHVSVLGADAALAGPERDAPAWLKKARHALNQAQREGRGSRITRPKASSLPLKKRRLPVASSANRVAPKWSKLEHWVPSEVIIGAHEKLRPYRKTRAAEFTHFLGQDWKGEIPLCNTDHQCLLRWRKADGKKLDPLETWLAAQALKKHPGLAYAEVNRLLQMAKAPNDPFYPFQWHYGAMDLEGAWDITTGNEDVIGAVIDTGVLKDHPDLKNRILGSADLIDDPDRANDGDGRDDDGQDVGDNACGAGCHSHHGTHVAGTMAAQTDNGSQVAGVAWSGKILGIRSLGEGGGSLFDISGGIYWAIGSDVDGVTRNSNPADVINMSLGGRGQSDAMNEAVRAAVELGTVVIVAAGNDGVDASDFTPANAPDAITIAALTHRGKDRKRPTKANYSNYGAVVDLAAPGGQQIEDIDKDGFPDGVLSTVEDFVTYYQGTSMAAPHVAGTAMLMKALEPNLDQDGARLHLQSTAESDVDCDGCGSGAVSAARALLSIEGRLDSAFVVASPAFVRAGHSDRDAKITFKNLGNAATHLALQIGGAQREKISLDVREIDLAGSENVEVNITIEREDDDVGEANITGQTTEGDIVVAVVQWTDRYINAAKSATIGALKVESDGSFTVERMVTTSALSSFDFKLFNLTPGDYLVLGLTDDDNDGMLEDHEGVGVYPKLEERALVTIAAQEHASDIDFTISPGFDPGEDGGDGSGDVGAACQTSADCQGGLYCETVFEGGYCSQDCSGGTPCPSESECYCLGEGLESCDYRICLRSCTSDADCRADEGYVCDADQTCYPGS